MPRYRVTTDQGVFEVELDRAPSSFQELKGLVEAELGRRGGALGFAEPLAEPERPAPQPPVIPEGAGLADPRRFQRGPQPPSLVRRGGEAVGAAVAPSILPGVGALAGAAAPFPMNLAAAPAGAMLGEVANRAVGITGGDLDETAQQVGLTGAVTAALPPAAGGTARAATAAARASRPGRLVAQELAVEEAQRLPQLRVPVASAADDLFALARQTNPRIPITPFRASLEDFRARQAITAKKGQQRGPLQLAEQIEGFAVGDEIDLQTLFENTKAAGRLLRQARQGGSPDAEGYAVIYRAGREALETAAAGAEGGAVGALDAALHAFRREAIRDDLAEIIADKVLSKPRQGDLRVELRMGALLDALTSDKSQYAQFQRDLAKALTPAEVQALVADVKALGKVKPLPAVAGAERGAGRGLIGLAGGAALGEAAGQAMGLPPIVGGGAGAFVATKASEIVAESLVNGRARPLLIRMLKANPSLSPQALSLLAAAASAQLAERPGGARMEP